MKKTGIINGKIIKVNVVFIDGDPEIFGFGEYPNNNSIDKTNKVILINVNFPRWQMLKALIHEFIHCALDIFSTPKGALIKEKKEEELVDSIESYAAKVLKPCKKKYRVEEIL